MYTGETNDLVSIETTSCGSIVEVKCHFMEQFVGISHCQIDYGPENTLSFPYHDTSDAAGSAGESILIQLSQQLQSSTSYYFSASVGDAVLKVVGSFQTGNLS